MKTWMVLAFVAMAASVSTVSFAKEGDVHAKVVPITGAYIPSGFDSSSDAFVVVNGLFPHTCYKLSEVKVDHVGPALHEVSTVANVTEGLCLTVMVPFSKEVQLGKLGTGEHKIHFLNGDGTYMEKRLVIEQ